MKIKDILVESKQTDEKLFKRIINSSFFNINWKPIFDSEEFQNLITKPDNILEILPILYHGGNLKVGTVNHIIYREKPMDTAHVIHNTINELSEENLSVSIRSMLFSSQNKNVSSEYGDLSIVVPLDDDYKLFYSTIVDDMFTSKVLFNKKDFNDGLVEYLDNLFKTDIFKQLLKEINDIFGSVLTPRMSTYVYKHIRYSLNTIFIRIPDSKNVYELDDFNNLIDAESIERAYEEMFDILSMAYSERNFNEVGEEDSEKLKQLMYKFAKELLVALVNRKRNWIYTEAIKYVESIKNTKNLSTVDYKTEIMLPEGDYAALLVRNVDDTYPIVDLYKYYLRNKSV